MSDSNDPIAQVVELSSRADALRESIAAAQRELTAVSAEERAMAQRLAALHKPRDAGAAGELTVLNQRGAISWRQKTLLVGLASSAATALLVTTGFLVFGPSTPPPPPEPPAVAVLTPPPPPPVVVPPPELAAPVPPELVGAAPLAPDPARTVARLLPPAEPWRHAPGSDARKAAGTAMGSLTVVCLPVKCDEIIDNGTALGPGHIFSRPTSAGRHTLSLHATNGVAKTITVEVHPDQLKDLRVSMAPTPLDIPPLRD